jgi:hypothetical protein
MKKTTKYQIGYSLTGKKGHCRKTFRKIHKARKYIRKLVENGYVVQCNRITILGPQRKFGALRSGAKKYKSEIIFFNARWLFMGLVDKMGVKPKKESKKRFSFMYHHGEYMHKKPEGSLYIYEGEIPPLKTMEEKKREWRETL